MTSVRGITFDCVNAAAAARFWASTLDGRVDPESSKDSADVRIGTLRLAFRRVPERKYVKNRVHLDLATDAFELDCARLLALGAVRLDDLTLSGRRWTTFADIEGNEFDLLYRG
jgi:hypothetical protein